MNCEPGDIARIIAPTNLNPNLGKIVQVVQITNRHRYPIDYGPIWEIKSRDKLLVQDWIIDDVISDFHGACPDCWLKPYRPPALDKSTTTNKELEKV